MFKHDFQETSRLYNMNIQTNAADGEENKLQQLIRKNKNLENCGGTGKANKQRHKNK